MDARTEACGVAGTWDDGDVSELWLARIQWLEGKLTNAERELVGEGLDAIGVRALAETIGKEIAGLKGLATVRLGGRRER